MKCDEFEEDTFGFGLKIAKCVECRHSLLLRNLIGAYSAWAGLIMYQVLTELTITREHTLIAPTRPYLIKGDVFTEHEYLQ